MSENEEKKLDSVICVTARKSKTTTTTIVEEPDFFADMQPVIETNQEVMTTHDKFAVISNTCEGGDDGEDGWNDVDDEAWS